MERILVAITLFILGALVIIAAGATIFYGIGGYDGMPKIVGGAIAAVLGLGMFLGSMMTTVDARSVGIQTSFGKYKSTLGPGFAWTAPWSDVEEWTTRNQTLRFAGDGRAEERDNFSAEPFVTVRLGNQSEAYVDLTVTYRITDKSVRGLWEQHKTFDSARRDFAVPQVVAAANAVFDGYDPFKGLNESNVDNPFVSVDEWSKRVTDKLRPLYASRSVDLIEVRVTFVRYDQRTQDKLRQYSDAIAETRIKAQQVKTAEEEARASNARRQNITPGCEALLRDLAAADQLKNLPAGWQCPGSSGPGLVVSGR